MFIGMTRDSTRALSFAAVALGVALTACGEPTLLSISSAKVEDGQHGTYELELRNDAGKKYASDGVFSVVYVDGAGKGALPRPGPRSQGGPADRGRDLPR